MIKGTCTRKWKYWAFDFAVNIVSFLLTGRAQFPSGSKSVDVISRDAVLRQTASPHAGSSGTGKGKYLGRRGIPSEVEN